MGISFPNEARSFDSKSNCVRFSGYDGIFKVKFHLAIKVLACEKILPKCQRERLSIILRCVTAQDPQSGCTCLLQGEEQRHHSGPRKFPLSRPSF